jgi:hypothetical protein
VKGKKKVKWEDNGREGEEMGRKCGDLSLMIN